VESDNTFDKQYDELEKDFRRQAKRDQEKSGHAVIYLPAIRPKSQVDFVFVGMEPSLNFAGSEKDASQEEVARYKIAHGFKSSMFSIHDFILHYSISHYLYRGDCHYHITDLSKGAMRVEQARREKPHERYKRWYPLLLKEIGIVSKENARVFAIGRTVEQFLKTPPSPFPRPIRIIPHFSPLAARYVDQFIAKRVADRVCKEFLGSFKNKECERRLIQHILKVAEDVMSQAGLCVELKDQTLSRLEKKTELTKFQKKLIFAYKLAFDEVPDADMKDFVETTVYIEDIPWREFPCVDPDE